MEIGGQYYIETDYSKFKRMDFNRIVTKSRLNALIESFKGGVVLTLITVNKNMEIVDGQGRFEARKALGLPILYVIDSDATIEDCRRINNANKPWILEDYVVSFAEQGNENYVNLVKCCSENNLSISRVLRLANHARRSHGKQDKGSSQIVANGMLKFSLDDVEKVKILKNKILEIAEALDKTTGLNDAFWTACKIAIETNGYNHANMLNSCRAYKMQYAQMSKLEDELKMLSQVYNYRKGLNNRLYFEDYMRNRGHNVRSYDNEYFSNREDFSTLRKENDNGITEIS